jgi:hypothetical protein
MLSIVRDACGFIGMMIFVVFLASVIRVAGESERDGAG